MESGRLPWMFRTHEDYNPNDIAALSQAKVATALIESGRVVLVPWMQVLRYDLVIEEHGRFSRVQCKTAQLFRGAIYFRPQSLRAAKSESGWNRVAAGYQGEIDFFGVYCPDNSKVYLIPLNEANTRGTCFLRIDPPKNNQQKRIRWAEQYEVRPLTAQRS